MILELIVGFALGILCGLIPGLHVNLISIIAISYFDNPLSAIYFLVPLSIAYTFADVIPAVIFNSPSSDTFQFRKSSRSIYYATFASSISIIILIFTSPFLIIIMPPIFSFIENYFVLALLFVSLIYLNSVEDLLVFLLAGTVGVISLDYLVIKEPLLCMLTGFFGLPALLVVKKNNLLIKNNGIVTIFPIFLGVLSSIFVFLLPTLTPAHAFSVVKKYSSNFSLTLGAINTSSMVLAIIYGFILNKARNGSIEVLYDSFVFDINHLIIMLLLCVACIFPAHCFTLFLAKKLSLINISKILVIFIFVTVLLISGPIGLLVLIVSTLIGFFCLQISVSRINLLGSLLLPTTMFYLV